MTKDYFAYGTLMCEDIMLTVTGRRFTRVSGFLAGYRRRGIKNEVYPGIIPEAGRTVEGIVYRDLTDTAWTALDTFEGEMYERRIVRVNLTDSTSIDAYTYVIRPEFENRLDSNDWDFEKFLEFGKKTFQKRYVGFKALKNGDR